MSTASSPTITIGVAWSRRAPDAWRRRCLWHWGSLLRLGNGVYGGGHYFTTTDHRHPGDALSRLVIEAKNDPEAAGRAGQLLAELVETPWNGMAADLITSAPPKPAQEHDRLDSELAAQRRTSPWR